jgi:hypothetical protein
MMKYDSMASIPMDTYRIVSRSCSHYSASWQRITSRRVSIDSFVNVPPFEETGIEFQIDTRTHTICLLYTSTEFIRNYFHSKSLSFISLRIESVSRIIYEHVRSSTPNELKFVKQVEHVHYLFVENSALTYISH